MSDSVKFAFEGPAEIAPRVIEALGAAYRVEWPLPSTRDAAAATSRAQECETLKDALAKEQQARAEAENIIAEQRAALAGMPEMAREIDQLKARLAEAEALAAERIAVTEGAVDVSAGPGVPAGTPAEAGEEPMAMIEPEGDPPARAAPRRALIVVDQRTGCCWAAGCGFTVKGALFLRALDELADGEARKTTMLAMLAGFANDEAMIRVMNANQRLLADHGLRIVVKHGEARLVEA